MSPSTVPLADAADRARPAGSRDGIAARSVGATTIGGPSADGVLDRLTRSGG